MEASKLFLRDRAPGTSEPCVGDAEGIAEEEWAAELGIFPGLVVVLIFFGVFDATVAQASSEWWFGRVPDPRCCVADFFSNRARLCDDVSPRRGMQLQ